MLKLGDVVRLREDAVYGQRRELAEDIGTVGDVREILGEACCTVVYEDRQCLICDAPVGDFEPVAVPH